MYPAQPSPDVHVFETDYGYYALLVNGSRIYSIGPESARRLRDYGSATALETLGLALPEQITDKAPAQMPLRSLSLAVAQKCNMGCTYCYAQQGSFGNTPKQMETEAALAAVKLLFRERQSGESVQITFLGGEPLMNRQLIHTSTDLAEEL